MEKFIAGMKRVFQSFLPGKRDEPGLGLPDIMVLQSCAALILNRVLLSPQKASLPKDELG
jgi:hypothetical protein